MGRWTPLILMAGGLAILLGTLLGISFPMGGQNRAQAPANGGRTSRVLPANINVNSTATGSAPANTNRSSVAQNNTTDDTTTAQNPTDSTTAQITPDDTQSNDVTDDTSENKEPIRALW